LILLSGEDEDFTVDKKLTIISDYFISHDNEEDRNDTK
jgi:hypothetical protein